MVGSCPICLDHMKTPAALTCGHVFCFKCIEQHVQHVATTASNLNRHTSCPSCRATASKKPIKLFFSPPDEAPEESQSPQKTWAEATIPTPFFAEVLLRGLREDLSATQFNYEMVQRQLESAQIEKRTLSSQNRRIISERDKAVRERDSLQQMYVRDKESLVAAGRQLESTVAALRGEVTDLRDELARASAAIDRLEDEKCTSRNKVEVLSCEIPTTENTSTAVPGSIWVQSAEGSRSASDGRANSPPSLPAHGKDLPPTTHSGAVSSVMALAHDPPPPLPVSMSLDEILAGGLRQYKQSRVSTRRHP